MMMLLTVFVSLWATPVLAQDSVDQAYQREYAYLAAEKRALMARLSALDGESSRAQGSVETDIARLEIALKRAEGARSDSQDALEARERAAAGDDESRMILDATISQAAESIDGSVDENAAPQANITALLALAANRIGTERSVTQAEGAFFLPDGVQVTGQIVQVGQIAAFGVSDNAAGPLRPIGESKFQLMADHSGDVARSLSTGAAITEIGLFLFEGMTNSVEEAKERSAAETVQAGGIVAWIIVGLGFLALGLAVIRTGILGRTATAVSRDELWLQQQGTVTPSVPDSIQGPLSNVLKHVQPFLAAGDREALFDSAEEGLSGDRARLERFSTVIMVVAAVAPLLGLLGTVTGMIATFAIITEHGTGDPRMLSGGISEALITTQLGLVVAIPALLVGNVLSGWSKNLQERIEQGVLVYINAHTKIAERTLSVLEDSASVVSQSLGLGSGEDVVA